MRAQWHRNTGASLPTPPIEARNVISCDTTLSLCIPSLAGFAVYLC